MLSVSPFLRKLTPEALAPCSLPFAANSPQLPHIKARDCNLTCSLVRPRKQAQIHDLIFCFCFLLLGKKQTKVVICHIVDSYDLWIPFFFSICLLTDFISKTRGSRRLPHYSLPSTEQQKCNERGFFQLHRFPAEAARGRPCILPSALPSTQPFKPLYNHVVYFCGLLAVLAVCCLLKTALNGC